MRAVFFDWDGTLVDSIPLLFSAHNYVRNEMGKDAWSKDEYRAAMLSSTREIYPKIYGDDAQKAQDMLYAFIFENHLKKLHVLDGAKEVVESLAAHDIPMGVVSNKRDDVLKREVEHLGWESFFQVYNGAGLAAKDKPSGVPLLYALSLHPQNLSIDDVVYVGDTESDLGCAKDAGCPCVYIKGELFKPELVDQYRPIHVVSDLFELKDVLISLVFKG
jgi:phosphoglycolate phosphatase